MKKRKVSKQSAQSVARQLSHRRPCCLVNHLVNVMLLQIISPSSQAPIQISNVKYRRVVDIHIPDLVDHRIHIRTVWWLQV